MSEAQSHMQSYMKSIFHGQIEEDLLLPYPRMDKDAQETLDLIVESVGKFCAKLDFAKMDREHQIPDSVIQDMKALGLFGLNIPEAYGGMGLSATAYARVMEAVAAHDASLGVTMGAHQSIGLKGILLAGTEEQKKRYLPKLATGEWVAAFALTEPGAGSDAASITTRAELDANGDYILNGAKIWITNGGFADVFTVFARTSDSDTGKPRITAFIVERSMGVTHGKPEEKMGIRASSTTELFFENVRVPKENVLGEVGKGFKVAMEVLNSGRLGLASGSVGASKTLLKLAAERAHERKAFGKTIAEFGMIKEKISRMAIDIYALESMTYLTTGLLDKGTKDYSVESAICKVFGSEVLWNVANESMQIAAGIGYMCEYPYERLMRDARINLIFEGTNEILRAFIALSGMQGPGQQLKEVAKAMREPIKGFGIMSEYVINRAKRRLPLLGEQIDGIHPALRKETVMLEDVVSLFAREVERVLRKHGKDIALKQFAQKRVAEAAVDIYALSAVLSRTSTLIAERGIDKTTHEIELTRGFAVLADHRLKACLGEMERDSDELMKQISDHVVASYQ